MGRRTPGRRQCGRAASGVEGESWHDVLVTRCPPLPQLDGNHIHAKISDVSKRVQQKKEWRYIICMSWYSIIRIFRPPVVDGES